MPIDTEGNTGYAQIQTAADHVLSCKDVLIGCGNMTRNTSCGQKEQINSCLSIIIYYNKIRLLNKTTYLKKSTSESYHVYITWPEVKPVKTVGVEVIPDPVAPPAFPSTRVRTVALRQSPTHTQVIWLSCKERLHVVHHHFKIPLLILSGSFTCSKENVGSHAKGR